MIKIAGSVHRSFTFPAEWQAAFNYYSDMERTLNILPHISIMHRYAEGQYRMVYATTELGIYRVRLFCDLQTDPDRNQRTMRVAPLDGVPEVKNKAGMYSLSAQGYYSSESTFIPKGEQTEIDYKLRLHARLPIPLGLRFMPGPVLNSIAQSIAQWRINEIAEGFIERSLRAFG